MRKVDYLALYDPWFNADSWSIWLLLVISTIFYFFSWYLYKPQQVDEKEVINVLNQLEDTADYDIQETNL